MPSARSIIVLGTGGTISARRDAAASEGYAVGRFAVDALLAGDGGSTEFEAVAEINSKDMDGATWRRLAIRAEHHLRRPEIAGLVVTHGTDTMEETAWLLARTLAATKPVVLTGAMRPSDAGNADGPRNLADALVVARSGQAGVVVAFAGSVFAAGEVRKVESRAAAAFAAAGHAPLAQVTSGAMVPKRAWPHVARLLTPAALPREAVAWPWVEVVGSGALADGRAIDALVAADVRGLAVAATGNGTVHVGMEAALQRAQDRGVAVLRASRCAYGGIEEAGPSGRFEASAQLTPAQARVELMLRLLSG